MESKKKLPGSVFFTDQETLSRRKFVPESLGFSLFFMKRTKCHEIFYKNIINLIKRNSSYDFCSYKDKEPEKNDAQQETRQKKIPKLDRSIGINNRWNLPPNIYNTFTTQNKINGGKWSKIPRKTFDTVFDNQNFYEKLDLNSELNTGWNRYKGKFNRAKRVTMDVNDLPGPGYYNPTEYSLSKRINFSIIKMRSPKSQLFIDFITSIHENFQSTILGPGYYETTYPLKCPCSDILNYTFTPIEWLKIQNQKLQQYRLSKFKMKIQPEFLQHTKQQQIIRTRGNGHTYVFRSKTPRIIIDNNMGIINKQIDYQNKHIIHGKRIKFNQKYIELITKPKRQLISIRDVPSYKDQIIKLIERNDISKYMKEKLFKNIFYEMEIENKKYQLSRNVKKKFHGKTNNIPFGSIVPRFEGDPKIKPKSMMEIKRKI